MFYRLCGAGVYFATSIKCHIEIAVLIAAGALSWPLVHRVEATELMRYVYPALVALHLLVALIQLWRYLFIVRTALVKPILFYMLTQCCSFAIIGMATGPQPVIEFDTYRWLVVWLRILSAAAVAIVAAAGLLHIAKGIRHHAVQD